MPTDYDAILSTVTEPDTRKKIRNEMKYDFRAVDPNITIMTKPMSSNVLGEVYRVMPTTIFMNPDLNQFRVNSGLQNSVQHEMEHVLQNLVDRRGKNSNYDSQVLAAFEKAGGHSWDLISQLQKAGGSQKLKEHLGAPPINLTSSAYIGGLGGSQYSLREQFAELSSLEVSSGKDLTKDPVVREEFFGNNQALIDTYKATTGLRTNRLDAKDLPPMTIDPKKGKMSDTDPNNTMINKLLNIIGMGGE